MPNPGDFKEKHKNETIRKRDNSCPIIEEENVDVFETPEDNYDLENTMNHK